MRRPFVRLVFVLAPLVLAAADPRGDVGPCVALGTPSGDEPSAGSGTGDPRIDVVRAQGEIVERGTALRFMVMFADPLPVPDDEGTPLRVDVVLRDPDVPVVSFRYYRDLNRIVRFDAVPDPLLQIALLPEHGANVFAGVVALDDTLTMTFPGRLITLDRDLEGLGLERIRWSVIARDEDDCDALGDGRPTGRLVDQTSPTPVATPGLGPSPSPSSSPPAEEDAGPSGWVVWTIVGIPIVALWVYALVLRRRGVDPAETNP